MHSGTTTWHKEEVMKHIKVPIRRLTKLSTRRIAMSKATIKVRQFAFFGLATAMTTGVTTVAPSAHADEVTATVFSAPGWDYANIRPGPSTDGQPIGKVQAGQAVQLDCYRNGGEVKGPYGSSTLWYKVKGYDSGWVADAMLSTGSDLPVTSECPAEQGTPPPAEQPEPVSGRAVDLSSKVPVSEQLLNYYYRNKDGGDVVIGWDYFKHPSGEFLREIYKIDIGQKGHYEADIDRDKLDLYLSLRNFDVWRTSENCFKIQDRYDFEWPYIPQRFDAMTGAAHEFTIRSSGCYPPGTGQV